MDEACSEHTMLDPLSAESTTDTLLLDPVGALATPPPLGNEILDGLGAEQQRVLRDHLEEIVLQTGDLLDAEGQEVSRVYFPVDALISIFAGKSCREGIEAASIGSNGMTAPSVLLDDPTALGDTVVQLGGRAWWVPVPILRQLADSDPELRSYLFGRIRQALRDIMDASVCAGRFTITERLARWLVQATHRVGAQRLAITHSALASILGVRRPSVTIGLQTIEGYGLIRSTRRSIVLRDLEGLSDLARLNGSKLDGADDDAAPCAQ
jgi:CRP-like cAMP-binding protein